MDEVFNQLQCTKEGLTTSEAEKRLQMFGPNKLEEKEAFFFCYNSRFQYVFCLFYGNKIVIYIINHKTGEQVPQILGFYVESFVMGDGICCHYRYCVGQWTGDYDTHLHNQSIFIEAGLQ